MATQETKTIACPSCGSTNPYTADECLKCGLALGPMREAMAGMADTSRNRREPVLTTASPNEHVSPPSAPIVTNQLGDMVTCPRCKGEGGHIEEVDCPDCGGTGRILLPEKDYRKYVKCETCGGAGKQYDSDWSVMYTYKTCWLCRGRRQVGKTIAILWKIAYLIWMVVLAIILVIILAIGGCFLYYVIRLLSR